MGNQIDPHPKKSSKKQREIKINSFVYAPDYPLSIYMDGNMELVEDPQLFLETFYSGGLLTCKHPKRGTIAEEAKEVLRKKKDLPERVAFSLNHADDVGYADDLGLFENMVLVRDKSDDVKKLEKTWFSMIEKYSYRDQLSLPVASFLTGVEVHAIDRKDLFRYIKRNRGHQTSVKFPGKKPVFSKKLMQKAKAFRRKLGFMKI